MLRNDSDQALLQLEHVLDLPLDVARLPLRAAGDLMDHDVGVRQREPLAFRPRAKQDRAHAGGHAEAIGGHVAGQKLHRVVDRQPAVTEPPGELM